ncbi:hypothetical protein BDN70DRAFT_20235 [Pholiota conissans]|uniref:Uncharacterized protein n=1 Tax=Pholiota conissans TaxID=109636 RepID=A0A9P5ZH44_9AGAR|nr:hypothetical protein BDN70DRAFT_20235 [Pholiota conissans]
MPAVVFSRRRHEPSRTSQRPQNLEHTTRSSPLPVVTESKIHLHIPLPSTTFSIGQKNIKPLHEAIFLAKDVSGLLSPDASRLRKRHLNRRASVIGLLSNSTVSISPTPSSSHSPPIQLAPTALSLSEAFSEILTLTILSETLASTIQQSPTSSYDDTIPTSVSAVLPLQIEHIIDSVVQVISTPSVIYLAPTASTARWSPPATSQNTSSSAVPYFHSLPSVRPLEVSSTTSFNPPTTVVSTSSASLTTTSSISITTPYVSNPTSLPPAYTFTSQSTTTSYLSTTSVTSISSTYVDSSSSSSATTTTNQYSECFVTSSTDFGPPQRVTETRLRATTVTATITKTVVASQTQYQELIQPTTISIVSLPSILAPLVVPPHSTNLTDGNRPKTAPNSTTAIDGAGSSTTTTTPNPTSSVTSSFPSNTQSIVPSSMQGKPLSPGNVSASHSSGSLPLILSVVTASFAFCLVMVLAVLYFRRRSQDRRFRRLY